MGDVVCDKNSQWAYEKEIIQAHLEQLQWNKNWRAAFNFKRVKRIFLQP